MSGCESILGEQTCFYDNEFSGFFNNNPEICNDLWGDWGWPMSVFSLPTNECLTVSYKREGGGCPFRAELSIVQFMDGCESFENYRLLAPVAPAHWDEVTMDVDTKPSGDDVMLVVRNWGPQHFSVNVATKACSTTPGPPSPTPRPTSRPTPRPTPRPTSRPTARPTPSPTPRPTRRPTPRPTPNPTPRPTSRPTPRPTPNPTPRPTSGPTRRPTNRPTSRPTPRPTRRPTPPPIASATPRPTRRPTSRPTPNPTPRSTSRPTPRPIASATPRPTSRPTPRPTPNPTPRPTSRPTQRPTPRPTSRLTPRPIPSTATQPTTPQPMQGPTPRPANRPTPRPIKPPTPQPTLPLPTPRPATAPTPTPLQRLTSSPVPGSALGVISQPFSGPTTTTSNPIPKTPVSEQTGQMNITVMVMIGIVVVCVTIVVGLYVRQRKPKETRPPNPTTPETSEMPHSDTTTNNVQPPTSIRNGESTRSAVGELVTGVGRVIINASQTTPPFAQIVQEEPEKPMIFGGLMDFKCQTRSVDPDELRRPPIPFASTAVALNSPEPENNEGATSLDQGKDTSIGIEGNDVGATSLDQGGGASRTSLDQRREASRDIDGDGVTVKTLDEEGLHFSIDC